MITEKARMYVKTLLVEQAGLLRDYEVEKAAAFIQIMLDLEHGTVQREEDEIITVCPHCAATFFMLPGGMLKSSHYRKAHREIEVY